MRNTLAICSLEANLEGIVDRLKEGRLETMVTLLLSFLKFLSYISPRDAGMGMLFSMFMRDLAL